GVILTRWAACGQSVQVPSGFPGGICHKAAGDSHHAVVSRRGPSRGPSNRRKQEVDMLISTKSGAPEKDRNASVSAAEVMGRGVQPHDQAWARSEPTTKAGMA